MKRVGGDSSSTFLRNQLTELESLRDVFIDTILGEDRKVRLKWTSWILGAILFIFLFRQSVWHQVFDAKLYDEGFISDLIWHNTFYSTDLITPNNYLASHLSLILWLFGCISFLWPFDQISWFATFFALQSSLALVALIQLLSRNSKNYLLVCIVSLTLVVGGGWLGALDFPHWEFWAAALLLFSLNFASKLQYKRALVTFLLALLVKEDKV